VALKLAVVTAGAVGAYFGGRLAQAGVEVRFLARGAHLAALKEQGLRVQSSSGDFSLKPSDYFVTQDAAEVVRGADLVFFAVKSFDTEASARALLPGLDAKTVVISLQNGVENEAILSTILGPERVAAGSAYIEATLDGPGAIKHRSLGRLATAIHTEAGQPVPLLDELKARSEAAGFSLTLAEDGLTLKWSKLVFISAFSGWTTAARRASDGIMAEPELREAYRATLLETATIAQAAGAKIDPAEVAKQNFAFSEKLQGMSSSMLYDFEQGKSIEVDALNGAVVRKGRELGLPTPYNQALLALLTANSPKEIK